MKTHLLFSLAIICGCGPTNAGGAFDCTNPATCPDNASCSAGALRCGPNKSVEQCKADGSGWMPLGHCADNQTCSGGQCSPSSCMGGATQCTPDGRIQTCLATNGTYSDPVPCPTGQACVGTSCIMTVCTPNARFCDGMQVRQCDMVGSNSTVVDTCTGNQSCANGTCLDACQAADLLKSFAGCTFYSVDMDNSDEMTFEAPNSNDLYENLIILSNQSPTITATVKVEVRNGANWTTLCGPAMIAAGQTHAFALRNSPTCDIGDPPFLDRHVEDSALAQGLAYRVTSTAPVVAYQYNSDDIYLREASSSGSTVLLPKATLGKKYYALNWPQPANQFGAPSRAAMDIVGTEDNTQVMVTSSTHIVAGPGVPLMNPGDTQSFTLNEGDVLQLETTSPGDDVSGSFIVSDKPVALFTGIECAPNPAPLAGSECDHVEEQILPLTAWGKNYVASRIALSGEDAQSAWRILASVPNTHVTLTVPSGGSVTPAGPFTLQPGQVQEITATNTSSDPGHFFMAADQPVLVMQMAEREAATITVVPVEQFLQTYAFQTPDIFDSVLAVTRYNGTPVILDGMALSDSLFVDAGGNYQVALYPVAQSGTGMVNAHTLTVGMAPDQQMHPAGIQVFGMDSNCSYGYVGGLNITVINPIP